MKIVSKIKRVLQVNWIKSVYFNFKKFPFAIAKKMPVLFYGSVKFQNISGKICINAPIQTGMIGFGKPYEMNTLSSGIAEIMLAGTIIFEGHVQFGKDYFVYVTKEAVLQMGDMSSLASKGKIICTQEIVFGTYARLGSECQVIDTNFHEMMDTVTQQKFPLKAPIRIGNYNFISNRVTFLSKSITPDYCTVASNSLCNKDYTSFGNAILIGGVPAQLVKENITRDWEGEKDNLNRYLKNSFI